MTADIVQAGYDELDRVAARFSQAAASTTQLRQRVLRSFELLERGGWQGQGAEAFSKEMRSQVFPALDRMARALEAGRAVTLQAKSVMQRAEEEAAAPFKGRKLGGGSAETVTQSGQKSSGGLRINGMQRIANGELFITDPKDGRDIHPSDAKQGQIGDCFFVTSLAVVAQQQPELIRNAIRQNSDGTFTVTFHEERGGFLGIGGSVRPVQITVAPEFPQGERVKDGKTQTVAPHIGVADVSSGKQEMWAMVVERAYAQWKGDGNAATGYTRLDEGGHTSDVLFALTGQKSTVRGAGDYGIGDLARLQREGQAITLASLSKDDVGKKPYYKDGKLVANHAYYVTDVNEQTGMVTIQNPWGWDEYKVQVPYSELKNNFGHVTVNPLRPR
jgi:WXG100 family type VII secretion target